MGDEFDRDVAAAPLEGRVQLGGRGAAVDERAHARVGARLGQTVHHYLDVGGGVALPVARERLRRRRRRARLSVDTHPQLRARLDHRSQPVEGAAVLGALGGLEVVDAPRLLDLVR